MNSGTTAEASAPKEAATSPEAPQPVLTPIMPPRPETTPAQGQAGLSPASPPTESQQHAETQQRSLQPSAAPDPQAGQKAEGNPQANGLPESKSPAAPEQQATPQSANTAGNAAAPPQAEAMPALSAAQQQAMQEQQQYIQDLAHLRQQQIEQQQQQQPYTPPAPVPVQGQPPGGDIPQAHQISQGLPQQQPNGLPGKMAGQNPQALLPSTPPQTPPPSPEEAASTSAVSPAGSPDAQQGASKSPNISGQDASFYKDLNDTLVYGEPGHRWNALEEISKRGEAPPETYTILAQTVAPNSPLLPGNLPDETASRLRQASFWALALLNSSQNAGAPAISPAVDPSTGQPQKDPKTGQDLYKILPGIREAIQVLSNKKEDPGVQRAAVQMIQQIGQSHPNDKAFLQSILSKVKTNDPNVRALVRMGIPSDPNAIAPPGGSPSESTPNGSQVQQVQQMQANKAAGGQV